MVVLLKVSVFIMCQTLKAAFSFSILRYLLEKVCQPDILAYLMNAFPNNRLRLRMVRKANQRDWEGDSEGQSLTLQ